jgi:hypothetical protein
MTTDGLAAEHQGTPDLTARIRVELASGQVIRVDRCCPQPFPVAPGSPVLADGTPGSRITCWSCGGLLVTLTWQGPPATPLEEVVDATIHAADCPGGDCQGECELPAGR